MVLPVFAQKQTKEEKEAAAKALYDAAVQSVNAKTFVIIPSSYTDRNGEIQNVNDNNFFFSSEGNNLFAQGSMVCGNSYTNIMEATEYTPNFDKKGNLKLRIVVLGRMLKGTYQISMRSNGNYADVIFTPINGTTLRFSGPLVPLNSVSYNKRSNPM